MEKIAKRDPLHGMAAKENELLRCLQDDCQLYHPKLLPRIIDCINYTDYEEVQKLHKMLLSWPIIPSQYALQLLGTLDQ